MGQGGPAIRLKRSGGQTPISRAVHGPKEIYMANVDNCMGTIKVPESICVSA